MLSEGKRVTSIKRTNIQPETKCGLIRLPDNVAFYNHLVFILFSDSDYSCFFFGYIDYKLLYNQIEFETEHILTNMNDYKGCYLLHIVRTMYDYVCS